MHEFTNSANSPILRRDFPLYANSNVQKGLTDPLAGPTMKRHEREHVAATLTCGGDTASTGVKTRGMHAELHRLVNPVEYPLTADTQYALAA